MFFHRCQPHLGRLAVVARLPHDLGPVRGDQDRVREGSDAVLDADSGAGLPLFLGNALLRQVDHQEDHSILGPRQECVRVEDVFLEGDAVRTPVAARENREDGPSGLLGSRHGMLVVRQPAVIGLGRPKPQKQPCGDQHPAACAPPLSRRRGG